MTSIAWPALGLVALTLGACVDPAPLALPDHHPASTAAPSGAVELPAALADYVTPDGFAARAPRDGATPSGHAGHSAPRRAP